jgi:hypothetical protein
LPSQETLAVLFDGEFVFFRQEFWEEVWTVDFGWRPEKSDLDAPGEKVNPSSSQKSMSLGGGILNGTNT